MRNLIATKPLVYNSRRLRVGAEFIARSRNDERVLIAIGKAAHARAQTATTPVVRPTSDAGGIDIEALRAAFLEQKSEEADKRWGIARLKRELGIED